MENLSTLVDEGSSQEVRAILADNRDQVALQERRRRFQQASECCSHQDCKTYNDHGRDQEVRPARKSCHTLRAADPLISEFAPPSSNLRNDSSSTGRKASRSQCSNGSVKPRLVRWTISSGSCPPSARTSRGFGVRASSFHEPGRAKRARAN